jgi:hypothetical protein
VQAVHRADGSYLFRACRLNNTDNARPMIAIQIEHQVPLIGAPVNRTAGPTARTPADEPTPALLQPGANAIPVASENNS